MFYAVLFLPWFQLPPFPYSGLILLAKDGLAPCDVTFDFAQAHGILQLACRELEAKAEQLTLQFLYFSLQLFNLRFRLATGQLDNVMQITSVKRDIARAMTELTAKTKA